MTTMFDLPQVSLDEAPAGKGSLTGALVLAARYDAARTFGVHYRSTTARVRWTGSGGAVLLIRVAHNMRPRMHNRVEHCIPVPSLEGGDAQFAGLAERIYDMHTELDRALLDGRELVGRGEDEQHG